MSNYEKLTTSARANTIGSAKLDRTIPTVKNMDASLYTVDALIVRTIMRGSSANR